MGIGLCCAGVLSKWMVLQVIESIPDGEAWIGEEVLVDDCPDIVIDDGDQFLGFVLNADI
jgi:hypothetical protein